MGKGELLREVISLVTLVINVQQLSILLLVKDVCGSLESHGCFLLVLWIPRCDSPVWVFPPSSF